MNRKGILVAILLLLCSTFIYSQTLTIGVKFFGLSFHPKGAVNANIMPLKLDKNGVFVVNRGATLSIEYFIWKDIVSVKFVQGLYSDCLARFGGFTHIGLRGKIFSYGQHSINGGIGPTFIFRRNWYEVEGYNDSFSFFHGDKDDYWQWRFIMYGGEIEYNYSIDDNIDLSTTFVPGYPDLMNLSFGIRYKK